MIALAFLAAVVAGLAFPAFWFFLLRHRDVRGEHLGGSETERTIRSVRTKL